MHLSSDQMEAEAALYQSAAAAALREVYRLKEALQLANAEWARLNAIYNKYRDLAQLLGERPFSHPETVQSPPDQTEENQDIW